MPDDPEYLVAGRLGDQPPRSSSTTSTPPSSMAPAIAGDWWIAAALEFDQEHAGELGAPAIAADLVASRRA